MLKRLLFSLMCVGIASLQLNAQWTNYNTENSGIIGNSTSAIAAQDDGRVWIGDSFSGVSEFDGNIWTAYNIGNSGMPINGVLQLEVAPNGDKWIATNTEGIAVFDDTNWTIYNQDNTGEIINFLVKSSIRFDGNGDAWIGAGTPSGWGGLVHYDGNAWEHYDPTNSNMWEGWYTFYGTADYETFYSARTGWGQTPYLYSFHPASGDTAAVVIPGGYNWTEVFGVDTDSQGNIWIATLDGVFMYTGTEWTHFHTSNSDIPAHDIRVMSIDSNDNIWLGTFGVGDIFGDGVIKYDGMAFTQYTIDNSGLTNYAIAAIEEDASGNIWIGHGNGVDVLEGGAMSIDDKQVQHPNGFQLLANYPNPFNPNTVISLQLAVGSTVDLTVYDAAGRVVIRLVQGQHLAAGEHSFSWNGKDSANRPVASGVYMYQLVTKDGNAQTRKMTLLR